LTHNVMILVIVQVFYRAGQNYFSTVSRARINPVKAGPRLRVEPASAAADCMAVVRRGSVRCRS
ncbi:MAG: hypothetical protein WD738_17585, partial [Pirellulales bacterium]